ncbi:SH3 domain-containing protein [Pyxidicoccus sp. 3LG]
MSFPRLNRSLLASSALLFTLACGEGLPPEESMAVEPEAEVLGTTESPLLFGILAGSRVRAVENVYLRTGPSTSNAAIRLVSIGEQATVLSETASNGFYQVNVGGQVGWSHGDYWDQVPSLYVNGYLLSKDQEKWLRWVAAKTVPRLTGTRAERLDKAARVSWWAMKEGIWDLGPNRPNPTSNPQSFSLCSTSTGDRAIWPVEVCNNNGGAWQVGLAGVQVNWLTLAAVEATARQLYAREGWTITQILDHTVRTAGIPAGSTEHTTIVNTTNSALRKSWLLRNHGVGFTHENATVYQECIVQGLSWCYGSGQTWDPAYKFASSRTAMLNSIASIRQHLSNLAP